MTDMDLAAKFEIIASAPRAKPLGLCGLSPEVDYPIVKIERVGEFDVFV